MTERGRQGGLTMVELVVTIVILAIALVGVAAIVQMGSESSAEVLLDTRAIALGEAYMDEILGRRFDENSDRKGDNPCFGLSSEGSYTRPCTEVMNFTSDTGEGARDKWDDVDDYDGLKEGFGETTAVPQDQEGNDRTGYENFHVEVAVRYAGDDTAWGGLNKTNAKLVTITIKYRGQAKGWTISAYKGNY